MPLCRARRWIYGIARNASIVAKPVQTHASTASSGLSVLSGNYAEKARKGMSSSAGQKGYRNFFQTCLKSYLEIMRDR